MTVDLSQPIQESIRCRQSGDVARANQILRDLLAKYPNFPPALHQLGLVAMHVNQPAIAIEWVSRAIAQAPAIPQFHSDLGEIYRRSGRLDDSLRCFLKAAELKPNSALAHFNLGVVHSSREEFAAAIESNRRALEIHPTFLQARTNLAVALNRENRLEEAIAECRRSVELNSNDTGAHWNLGVLLLRSGQFEEGWRQYDWRWKVNHFPMNRRGFSKPFWDGSDIGDEMLLLHTEQGLGDAIQFARYIPMIAARVKNFVLECQPELKRLITPLVGIERIFTTDDALPDFAVHAPLLVLPKIIGTKYDTIPWPGAYLSADLSLVEQWREKIGADARRKIGIAWAGRPTHPDDRSRSIPATLLLKLADVPNVSLFSLQKGEPAKTYPRSSAVTDLTDDLQDFADTAALIANLDLVISVDTSVAHLAGAMGKPVWTLLPFASEWRWMVAGESTPWYPTMKLFRQKNRGDWNEVIERVMRELSNPPAALEA